MPEDAKRILPDTNSSDAKNPSDDGQTANSDTDNSAQPVDTAESADSEEQAAAGEIDNSNRMDSAKAFYRAIYAGDDVSAEKYGMNVQTINNQGASISNCVNCDQLAADFEQAQAKTTEIEGLYKRMAADFDNYRKRIEREREDLVGIGVQKAVESLLPALDDLDRAQANFNNNSEPADVIESLKLISARFAKCLEQLGIKPLEPIGQPFDPRLHEPVQQVVTTEVPDGAVVHDLRRGYALGEKVIRPTLVNVAIAHKVDQDQSSQPKEGKKENDSQSDVGTDSAQSSQ
jgi:molecular chaperone GrpE (heat shock protein)